MKKTDEENVPNIKKQGWSARELVKQGANEESEDVVEKITNGDREKQSEENRSLVDILFPPNRPERTENEVSVRKASKTGNEVKNQ